MATISHKTEDLSPGVVKITWETMGDDDVGDAYQLARYPDKTVTITGTFGSATVTFEGSNDNTNWFTLSDQAANAISHTSAGADFVAENPLYFRPQTAGGTGTDVDVIMVAYATLR